MAFTKNVMTLKLKKKKEKKKSLFTPMTVLNRISHIGKNCVVVCIYCPHSVRQKNDFAINKQKISKPSDKS